MVVVNAAVKRSRLNLKRRLHPSQKAAAAAIPTAATASTATATSAGHWLLLVSFLFYFFCYVDAFV